MASRSRCLLVFIFALLPLLSSCSGTTAATASSTTTATAASQWVVAWGASSQNATTTTANPGGAEQSFRFLVLPSVPGTQERVHFSNVFGTSPVTIGAASLAVATTAGLGPAVDATHSAPLTFSGSTTVTLQPKQEIDSDPVNVSYTFGQWLAVSMYLQGTFPALTQHNSQISDNYATAPGAGNTISDASGTSFTQTNQEWFLMSAVEAYGPYSGTVAIFGSSSVDGHGANYGNATSYPVFNLPVAGQNNQRPTDWLARSLVGAGYSLGVANAGLLGDPAAEDPGTAAGNALAGIDRFQHDVLALPGIKAVVLYTGGIDLRADCKQATDVEATLTAIVAQAYTAGVRVVLATLPPSEYCLYAGPQPSTADPYNGDLNPGPENAGSTQRRALNDWIRTSGAKLPGVVSIADFDAVLLYPAHPDFLLPNLVSSDNFHPNGVGYGVQNSAISLTSLLGH